MHGLTNHAGKRGLGWVLSGQTQRSIEAFKAGPANDANEAQRKGVKRLPVSWQRLLYLSTVGLSACWANPWAADGDRGIWLTALRQRRWTREQVVVGWVEGKKVDPKEEIVEPPPLPSPWVALSLSLLRKYSLSLPPPQPCTFAVLPPLVRTSTPPVDYSLLSHSHSYSGLSHSHSPSPSSTIHLTYRRQPRLSSSTRPPRPLQCTLESPLARAATPCPDRGLSDSLWNTSIVASPRRSNSRTLKYSRNLRTEIGIDYNQEVGFMPPSVLTTTKSVPSHP